MTRIYSSIEKGMLSLNQHLRSVFLKMRFPNVTSNPFYKVNFKAGILLGFEKLSFKDKNGRNVIFSSLN